MLGERVMLESLRRRCVCQISDAVLFWMRIGRWWLLELFFQNVPQLIFFGWVSDIGDRALIWLKRTMNSRNSNFRASALRHSLGLLSTMRSKHNLKTTGDCLTFRMFPRFVFRINTLSVSMVSTPLQASFSQNIPKYQSQLRAWISKDMFTFTWISRVLTIKTLHRKDY